MSKSGKSKRSITFLNLRWITGKQIAAITIALMIILGIPGFIVLKPLFEKTRIEIYNVHLDKSTLYCDDSDTAQLVYTLSYISGKRKGEGLPYYLLLNTTNTCGLNSSFFNRTPSVMCYNAYDYGNNRVQDCTSNFLPLRDYDVIAKSWLNTETRTIENLTKTVNMSSSCKFAEIIQVCGKIDGEPYCSKPSGISITYVPCHQG